MALCQAKNCKSLIIEQAEIGALQRTGSKKQDKSLGTYFLTFSGSCLNQSSHPLTLIFLASSEIVFFF